MLITIKSCMKKSFWMMKSKGAFFNVWILKKEEMGMEVLIRSPTERGGNDINNNN